MSAIFIGLGYLSERPFICRGTLIVKVAVNSFPSLYFKIVFIMGHRKT